VVQPTRDHRGRLYSVADVKRLQLLAAAVERGHAIGRVAALADADVETLLAAPPASQVVPDGGKRLEGDQATKALFAALAVFDAATVERELDRLALVLKPRELVNRVLLRSLRQIGDEWHADRMTIAQEHMLSGAVRNLLGGLVRLYARDDVPRRLLFATPSGERHEFGILSAAMLAAAGGLGVVYMGPDVPGRQIVDSASRSGVDAVVLGMVYSDASREIGKQIEYVLEHLPSRIELWVGGALPRETERALARRQIVLLPSFDLFERELARFGARF
jgi:MerR family transcriptional regulator, light-induced transcriptional regulator